MGPSGELSGIHFHEKTEDWSKASGCERQEDSVAVRGDSHSPRSGSSFFPPAEGGASRVPPA